MRNTMFLGRFYVGVRARAGRRMKGRPDGRGWNGRGCEAVGGPRRTRLNHVGTKQTCFTYYNPQNLGPQLPTRYETSRIGYSLVLSRELVWIVWIRDINGPILANIIYQVAGKTYFFGDVFNELSLNSEHLFKDGISKVLDCFHWNWIHPCLSNEN